MPPGRTWISMMPHGRTLWMPHGAPWENIMDAHDALQRILWMSPWCPMREHYMDTLMMPCVRTLWVPSQCLPERLWMPIWCHQREHYGCPHSASQRDYGCPYGATRENIMDALMMPPGGTLWMPSQCSLGEHY